jgi:hypothetical protein
VSAETLVNGNTAFGIAMYHQLRTEPGNIFYSPYSMSVALTMAYSGARTTTGEEMAEVLHIADPASVHAAHRALRAALDTPADPSLEGSMQLHVVNAMWLDAGYSFLPEFTALVDTHYGAPPRAIDFQNNPEPSRLEINGWVSEQTHERIEDLLPENSIDSLTRAVLANAIYFNANWSRPFFEGSTADAILSTASSCPLSAPTTVASTAPIDADGPRRASITAPKSTHARANSAPDGGHQTEGHRSADDRRSTSPQTRCLRPTDEVTRLPPSHSPLPVSGNGIRSTRVRSDRPQQGGFIGMGHSVTPADDWPGWG